MLDFFESCAIIQKLSDGARQRTEYGGIAQLGERLNGIQEVSGSIPLISTNKLGKSEKNLEIKRFQGFFLSKSGKYAVFAICACALDF